MANNQELKAHRTLEERAEKTASRGGLLSHFLTRAGKFWCGMRLANTIDAFDLARQIPQCVRPS